MNFNINFTYQNQPHLKLIMLGYSVGKTCIVNRFIYNEFNKDTLGTVGSVIYGHRVSICEREASLQIIDTSGFMAYHPGNRVHYHNLNAAIIAFDFSEKVQLKVLYTILKTFKKILAIYQWFY